MTPADYLSLAFLLASLASLPFIMGWGILTIITATSEV